MSTEGLPKNQFDALTRVLTSMIVANKSDEIIEGTFNRCKSLLSPEQFAKVLTIINRGNSINQLIACSDLIRAITFELKARDVCSLLCVNKNFSNTMNDVISKSSFPFILKICQPLMYIPREGGDDLTQLNPLKLVRQISKYDQNYKKHLRLLQAEPFRCRGVLFIPEPSNRVIMWMLASDSIAHSQQQAKEKSLVKASEWEHEPSKCAPELQIITVGGDLKDVCKAPAIPGPVLFTDNVIDVIRKDSIRPRLTAEKYQQLSAAVLQLWTQSTNHPLLKHWGRTVVLVGLPDIDRRCSIFKVGNSQFVEPLPSKILLEIDLVSWNRDSGINQDLQQLTIRGSTSPKPKKPSNGEGSPPPFRGSRK